MKQVAIAFLGTLLAITAVPVLSQAQPAAPTPAALAPGVTKAEFGKLRDGRTVDVFTLANLNGMIVKVMSLGAVITEIRVPDRNGKVDDVVLGYDNLAQYESNNNFFGALVGRVANRINNASFTLDGQSYRITSNLHGGRQGFNRRLWQGETKQTADGPAVVLSYTSADGEEGFPGKLDCTVTYTLTDKNELKIDYAAVTDKPTIVNLSNHSYFNLAGVGSSDVRKHVVTINADKYTVAPRPALIPTGEIASVEGTPMDFRKPKEIGQDVAAPGPAGFYDHCYMLGSKPGELFLCAKVTEPTTGRVLEVLTTEPAVQLYTPNGTQGRGIGGTYGAYAAFCLETQHPPDAINHPNFPSIVLRPGEKFASQTIWRFSTSR
jgi:aldose 1-epimerase